MRKYYSVKPAERYLKNVSGWLRELHDDLAQTLFFLNVKLRQGDIEEAKAAVSEIDNSLRQAIFNLRTPPEEGTSLEQRIHTYLRELAVGHRH